MKAIVKVSNNDVKIPLLEFQYNHTIALLLYFILNITPTPTLSQSEPKSDSIIINTFDTVSKIAPIDSTVKSINNDSIDISKNKKIVTLGLGLSFFYSTNLNIKNDEGTDFIGVTIAPEVRLIRLARTFSISLSSPITLGINYRTDDYDNADYFALGYDLPLALNLNIGSGAAPIMSPLEDENPKFGFMIGYGIAHHRAYSNYIDSDDNRKINLVHFSGDLFHTALVWGPLMLRISYLSNKSENRPLAFSIGILFRLEKSDMK